MRRVPVDVYRAKFTWIDGERVERSGRDPFAPIRTCREVAQVVGVSHQRVQQIESEALDKIAHAILEIGDEFAEMIESGAA